MSSIKVWVLPVYQLLANSSVDMTLPSIVPGILLTFMLKLVVFFVIQKTATAVPSSINVDIFEGTRPNEKKKKKKLHK